MHELAESAFDDQAADLDLESAGCGFALDDLKIDAEAGDVFDGLGLVAVGPGFGDGGGVLAALVVDDEAVVGSLVLPG
ncbi:hypothetical protein ACFWFF_14350 [Streptomyces sp. NPDC060223]|uniref:hypothetical protein n=1 Tax=unclassified Streptomyces TaxID=2593676 RepID=UPI00363E80D8